MALPVLFASLKVKPYPMPHTVSKSIFQWTVVKARVVPAVPFVNLATMTCLKTITLKMHSPQKKRSRVTFWHVNVVQLRMLYFKFRHLLRYVKLRFITLKARWRGLKIYRIRPSPLIFSSMTVSPIFIFWQGSMST